MTDQQSPFALEGLDRVLHEKARLAILTSLIAHPKGLSFGELKQLCALTDGNLSRHMQILEEAGMVNITKEFVAKRPHTTCTLTPLGQKRFAEYLSVLEGIVKSAHEADKSTTIPTGAKPSPA